MLATRWAGTRTKEDAIVTLADFDEDTAVSHVSWERLVNEAGDLRGRLAAIGATDQRAVVLALPNSPLTIALWLAIMANNAIVQAIDVDSGVLAFERSLQATDPAAVFVSAQNAGELRKAIASTGSTTLVIVVTSLELDGRYADFGLAGTASVPADAPPSSVAGVLPTSGTSGAPKLVQLTNHNYLMAAERLSRNSGYLASDRHYLCSPFFHTNGQLYLAAPPLLTGGSIAIVPRFSGTHYFSGARRTGATVSSMVAPPMRIALHKAIERTASGPDGEADDGGLRLIQYGMTMSTADWREWDARFPDIEMRQIYGQTESVTGVLGGSPWDTDDRRAIGRPFVGVPAVRLVTEDGSAAADGEPGELWVKGDPGSTLMLGYLDAPGATAEALVDGCWLRTGDVMVRHPDGRFEFRGRRMHIIRRGGENISTYALELDLQACPLVSDAAVTAKADDRLDSLVIAHVIPAAGYSEAAFLAWCRENLGKRGVPDEVREHTDFPRTGSGRVIARELG